MSSEPSGLLRDKLYVYNQAPCLTASFGKPQEKYLYLGADLRGPSHFVFRFKTVLMIENFHCPPSFKTSFTQEIRM